MCAFLKTTNDFPIFRICENNFKIVKYTKNLIFKIIQPSNMYINNIKFKNRGHENYFKMQKKKLIHSNIFKIS